MCGAFQLQKQRKMNELDVVVTLCLHQLEHVANSTLPGDLSTCLTFEAPALVNLRHRIEELKQERIVQKRQHQYAVSLFSMGHFLPARRRCAGAILAVGWCLCVCLCVCRKPVLC